MLSHLPDSVRVPIMFASSAAKLPADQLMVVALSIMAIFAGFIHTQIRNTVARHVYAATVGTIMAYTLLGQQVVHLFTCSICVYAILALSAAMNKTKYAPIIVAVFSLTYLSIAHIGRILYTYLEYKLDSTTAMMIAVVKLNTLAWAFADGQAAKKGEVCLNLNYGLRD
jgi:hypothetical protein